MFENKKPFYMTRSVKEEIHPEIIMILWHLIQNQKDKDVDLDYLQVFELSKCDNKQAIIHRQEIPSFSQYSLITLKQTKPIIRTIWCIDGGEVVTMLFPEDY